MQIAAVPVEEAASEALAQDWLHIAFEQYYSSYSPAVKSCVSRNNPSYY
jgi:hypothetical protein